MRVLSLTFLLGLTWITGFLLYSESIAMAYIFTIANGLQGVVIFIDCCVLNKKIRHAAIATIKCLPVLTLSSFVIKRHKSISIALLFFLFFYRRINGILLLLMEDNKL